MPKVMQGRVMFLPAVMLFAAPAFGQSPSPLQAGAEAPNFGFDDRHGASHQLKDLRGQVVVLEWTSHLCPSVKHAYDSRAIPDTRRELQDRAAWITIDSSWFAEDLREELKVWRRERNIDNPFAIDATGKIGSAYGMNHTPSFVVIDRNGRVAYSGRLHAPAETGKQAPARNLVIDAVVALQAGKAPTTAQLEAQGCSIKYRTALEDPAEDTRAKTRELYEWALMLADEGEPELVLQFLGAAFRNDYETPAETLIEPRFSTLRTPAWRPKLRDLLARHTRQSNIVMTPPAEPGGGLLVSGKVRDAAAKPVAGALVHLWHTDARGFYSENGMDTASPRLFGVLRTDDQGCFQVRTIRPAHYADQSGAAQHIHFEVSAAGFQTCDATLTFQDDPIWKRPGISQDRKAVPVAKNSEGVDTCDFEITMVRGSG